MTGSSHLWSVQKNHPSGTSTVYIVVIGRSDWPLPSQSPRVRMLLYLAEGMLIGAGLTLVLLKLFGAVLLDIETGSIDITLTVFSAFFLFVGLFFLLRGAAIVGVSRQYSRNSPPEYRDWHEARRWTLVAAVALSIAVMLLGVSVILWGWWSVVFLQDATLLLLGAVLSGLFLYTYVLHRIGV